jgi:hypothetical protein
VLRRTPIRKRRPGKPRRGRERDKNYMAWIAEQPCIVCESEYVEVAHVGERGFSQKCHDRETLPICAQHHRIGRDAQHNLGKGFYSHHGLDKQRLIAEHQQRYDFLRKK